MISWFVFVAALVSVSCMTTVTMPTTTMVTTTMGTTTMDMMTTILYDSGHKVAMIVRADGCYEYHLNHQDFLDSESDVNRPILEARILDEFSRATNIQEMGHNHINHMTQEIINACASVPVYSWDVAARR